MIIPKRMLNNWKLLKEHGDVLDIVKSTVEAGSPISRITIGSALKTGRGTKTTIIAINNFYKNKASKVKRQEKSLIEELGG